MGYKDLAETPGDLEHGLLHDYEVGKEPRNYGDQLADFGNRILEGIKTTGKDFVGKKTEHPDVYSGESLAEVTREGTSWDRAKKVFENDDLNYSSPQKMMIAQTTLVGFACGAIYGAMDSTKGVRERFIRHHEATVWNRPLEATSRLNDTLFYHGARGAMKYGAKVAFCTFTYASMVHVIQAVRNKSGIIEYTAGGMLAGACWRLNMGPSGMVTAGLLGGLLGTIGGSVSYGLLRLTGKTYEETLYWKKFHALGDERHKIERQREKSSDPVNNPIRMHDVFNKENLLGPSEKAQTP